MRIAYPVQWFDESIRICCYKRLKVNAEILFDFII